MVDESGCPLSVMAKVIVPVLKRTPIGTCGALHFLSDGSESGGTTARRESAARISTFGSGVVGTAKGHLNLAMLAARSILKHH
jgi:hypothetical protein